MARSDCRKTQRLICRINPVDESLRFSTIPALTPQIALFGNEPV